VKTSQFDYLLPTRLIAQTPVEPRDHSRLLVVDRKAKNVEHSFFYHIGNYLHEGDLLVVNRTRVIPARIFATKTSGGNVEILLLRKENELTWEALIGGKKVKKEMELAVSNNLRVKIIEELDSSKRRIQFNLPVEDYLTDYGQMPLPPYIHEKLLDPERYQTVYGDRAGSAAAPTAGLHFTNELMNHLKCKGIQFAEVTLHVGLDTFLPVTEENAEDHLIHSEWCEVTQVTTDQINFAHKERRRVIAVGTTTVRTLESAACLNNDGNIIQPFSGMTNLYVIPGYSFKVVDGLITNFHLPKSTLLMMVSALAGWERISEWYEIAKKNNYRFYSFGDAMFIQ
jgi:S-adenosylmethionine:tRNA ribosyltransferase-isomerase